MSEFSQHHLVQHQGKRKHLFRRLRDAFINVQSNGVVTLKPEFVDLDRRIDDSNFEVDGWGFRAFWHPAGLTESEVEFFFQECASISAAQLGSNNSKDNNNNNIINSENSNNSPSGLTSSSISVDLAEAAVYVRRAFDCRRQQLHDILKRIRMKQLSPADCPFFDGPKGGRGSGAKASRIVIFNYLTEEGGLNHSEAFLLMDACSVPRDGQHAHSLSPPPSSSSAAPLSKHYSGTGADSANSGDIDAQLLCSCLFVFPLPDSVAFSLLLGKVVDSLSDSFRGSGPTGVTAIVHSAAKNVLYTSPDEVEDWLRAAMTSPASSSSSPSSSLSPASGSSSPPDIRLAVEQFASICHSIAAGMPRAECILLHSLLSDDEEAEFQEMRKRHREKYYDDAVADMYNNNDNDDDDYDDGGSGRKGKRPPTVSLKKFVQAVADRFPRLTPHSFVITCAEVRGHVLAATYSGFNALFAELVRIVMDTGEVLDRAGAMAAFRAVGVTPVVVPDITLEQLVTAFLLRYSEGGVGGGCALQLAGGGGGVRAPSDITTSGAMNFVRSFVDALRGPVPSGRMSMVEKLFFRLTGTPLPPPSGRTGKYHKNKGYHRRHHNGNSGGFLGDHHDDDSYDDDNDEMDDGANEFANRNRCGIINYYYNGSEDDTLQHHVPPGTFLSGCDLLKCFAPDLVHGGRGTQQYRLEKTATKCYEDLVAYIELLDELLMNMPNSEDDGGGYDYDRDGENYNNYSHSNEKKALGCRCRLSLDDFCFFWANWCTTVQDDAEFTMILWEGFSMHKNLNEATPPPRDSKNRHGRNKSHHHHNHHHDHGNSPSSSPAQSGRTTPRVASGDRKQRNNNDNNQQSPPTSPTGGSVAALIAASHEEARKRRLAMHRIANNEYGKYQAATTTATASPSNQQKRNRRDASSSRRRNNNDDSSSGSGGDGADDDDGDNDGNDVDNNYPIVPRYHHHYHHPHTHEEGSTSYTKYYKKQLRSKQEQPQQPQQRPPQKSASAERDDHPLEHRRHNQHQKQQQTTKNDTVEFTDGHVIGYTKDNRPIVLRAVVEEGRGRGGADERQQQEPPKPMINSHAAMTTQKPSALPGRDQGNRTNNNNSNNRYHQNPTAADDDEPKQEINGADDYEFEYEDDGGGYNAGSGADNGDAAAREENEHNKNNNRQVENDVEARQFYEHQRQQQQVFEKKQQRQQQQHEYEQQQQQHGDRANSKNAKRRPELADAVPIMLKQEQDEERQQRHHRPLHQQYEPLRPTRRPTALEAYFAAQEKLDRDIDAYHHRDIDSAVNPAGVRYRYQYQQPQHQRQQQAKQQNYQHQHQHVDPAQSNTHEYEDQPANNNNNNNNNNNIHHHQEPQHHQPHPLFSDNVIVQKRISPNSLRARSASPPVNIAGDIGTRTLRDLSSRNSRRSASGAAAAAAVVAARSASSSSASVAKKKFQGFLPSFGVTTLQWNGVPRYSARRSRSSQQGQGGGAARRSPDSAAEQAVPRHLLVSRKKFIAQGKESELF